jgi:hypothetical protein
VFEFEEFCKKQVDDSSPTRVVSDEDRSDFEEALHELQNTLASSGFNLFDCSGQISHDFSSQLITELTNNVQFIFDLDYLISEFSFSSVNHAISVLEVVQELFHDIPQFESVVAHARSGIATKMSHCKSNNLEFSMLVSLDLDSSSGDEQDNFV